MNENKPVLVRRKDGDWEDKSDDVLEWRRVQKTHRIEICFKSAPGQWFPYSQKRVRLLESPIRTHSPVAVRLRIAGKVLRGVDAITEYADFYIVSSQGRRKRCLFKGRQEQARRRQFLTLLPTQFTSDKRSRWSQTTMQQSKMWPTSWTGKDWGFCWPSLADVITRMHSLLSKACIRIGSSNPKKEAWMFLNLNCI